MSSAPQVTVLTSPGAWLGGGKHLRQMESAARALGEHNRVISVGSLRGPGADRRLPAGTLGRLGPRATRALGDVLWRDLRNVHRLRLTIPPARRELLTVLDLMPLHFDDEGPMPRGLREQAKAAVGVVTSTTLIADEIRDVLGVERVWLVPPAVDDRFFTPPESEYGGRPYVLHAGGATSRKGLELLGAAWPVVREIEPELELVLVGPPHPHGRDALISQPRVRYGGQPSDDDLISLMQHARAVVVPSTYEGFGMPVAEAMACGVAVVVLAGTAPAEVGGQVAVAAASEPGADGLAEALVTAVRLADSDPARLAGGRERARRWTVESVRQLQKRAYDEAFD